jgi:RNase P subunit RPR2
MLQVNGKDERIRVWRSQRELVQASVATCERTGEKQRFPVKGHDRREPWKGYDRP